jgi:hypothetical protein
MFSVNTAPKKILSGRRHAAKVVDVFSLQVVSLKYDRHSIVSTDSHIGSEDSYPHWDDKIVSFELSRPSCDSAFASIICLPREAALFDSERAQDNEGPARSLD